MDLLNSTAKKVRKIEDNIQGSQIMNHREGNESCVHTKACSVAVIPVDADFLSYLKIEPSADRA